MGVPRQRGWDGQQVGHGILHRQQTTGRKSARRYLHAPGHPLGLDLERDPPVCALVRVAVHTTAQVGAEVAPQEPDDTEVGPLHHVHHLVAEQSGTTRRGARTHTTEPIVMPSEPRGTGPPIHSR